MGIARKDAKNAKALKNQGQMRIFYTQRKPRQDACRHKNAPLA